jgi:hypothetical protein
MVAIITFAGRDDRLFCATKSLPAGGTSVQMTFRYARRIEINKPNGETPGTKTAGISNNFYQQRHITMNGLEINPEKAHDQHQDKDAEDQSSSAAVPFC